MATQAIEGGDLEAIYFASFNEFLNYLDNQIKNLEDAINAVQRNINQLEPRLANFQSLLNIVKKLVGKENVLLTPYVEVTGLRIVIDPKPIDEYDVLKESVDSMMDKLTVLKKVRELVRMMASESRGDSPILVQLKSGVPIKLLVGVAK